MAERVAIAYPMPGATRYDFRRAAPITRPDQPRWDGWKVEAYNASNVLITESLPGGDFTPDHALPALAARDWVVARWAPAYHVRAWRGDRLPVTRIDLHWTDQRRWRVRKWRAGWRASTDPASDELKPDGWDAQVALQWLLDRAPTDHLDLDGWRLERAGNFVRAWKGPRRPVRNAGQIHRMRRAVTQYRIDTKLLTEESWRVPVRPTWIPESLGLSLEEIEALDFAYLL